MQDLINTYRQGETLQIPYSEFVYNNTIQTSIVGIFNFYFEIVDNDTRVNVMELTNVDMTIADNGSSPTVEFDLDTSSLSAETIYECEFAMQHIGDTNKVSLDSFYLRLRKPVAVYP